MRLCNFGSMVKVRGAMPGLRCLKFAPLWVILLVGARMDGFVELAGLRGMSDRNLAKVWAKAKGMKEETVRKRARGVVEAEMLPCLHSTVPPLVASRQAAALAWIAIPGRVLQLAFNHSVDFAARFFQSLLPQWPAHFWYTR